MHVSQPGKNCINTVQPAYATHQYGAIVLRAHGLSLVKWLFSYSLCLAHIMQSGSLHIAVN